MIGKMAIAIALAGFTGFRCSVTPISFQNQVLFTIFSILSKNKQKIDVGR